MGIKIFPAAFLLFCIAQNHCTPAAEVSTKLYDLSHLLKPQLDFEINLIVPDSSFFFAFSLPPALTQSMEYLAAKQVPFRLWYNLAQKLEPPSRTRSARHAWNRIANFVFFALQSKTQLVDLYEVVASCTFKSPFVLSSTVPRDFFHLIVDGSAMKELWKGWFVPTLDHTVVPLYFNIFYWNGPWFAFGHAYLVREMCECDDPVLSRQNNIFNIMNEPNGMERLAQRIRTDKKDLRGRKLIMCLPGDFKHAWDSLLRHTKPFTFRSAHSNLVFGFQGLLHPFSAENNVTFDEVVCPTVGGPTGREVSYMHVMASYHCDLSTDECRQLPMSLYRFNFAHTLSFTKPTQPGPLKLPSLAAPFRLDLRAAAGLLGSSICTALVLIALMVGKAGITETLLSVFSGLVGKSLVPRENPRALPWYTMWLLLIGFISISYTNVLQSIAIVPAVHYSERTFEAMLRENYTFESYNYNWMKRGGREIVDNFRLCCTGDRKSEFIEMHKQLVEHVIEMKKAPTWHALVEKFSDGQREALIVINTELESFKWIPAKTGLDLVVGSEQFFPLPIWWIFVNIERGSLLAKTLEQVKQVGFFNYFFELQWTNVNEIISAAAGTEFQATERLLGQRYEASRLSIADSLVSESLVLFLYGISIAVMGFVGEIIVKALTYPTSVLCHKIRKKVKLLFW